MKWTKAKYQAYLTSPHWKKLQRLMYRMFPRCYICGSKEQLNIHHKTYKNLRNEALADLVVLCETHHLGLHHWAHLHGKKPDWVAVEEYWVYVRV